MKKHFKKELMMTNKDNENFKNSTNVTFVIKIILILMLK